MYVFELFRFSRHQMYEDIKGAIRHRKSTKARQYNNQKKKNKSTNKEIQNTTQKTKDRATRTPLNHGVHQCA